jgi:hypothetical protein
MVRLVRSTVGVALALLLASVVVAAGPVAVADGQSDAVPGAYEIGQAGAEGRPQLLPQAGVPPEADNTLMRIQLHENGSATWTLQVRTRLHSESEVASYERFQQEFRNDSERFRRAFEESMVGVVDNAERVTGRNMTVTRVNVGAEVQVLPRRWGVVTYRFQWDGFAATSGDSLLVGDVFEGGLFIAENDTLELVAPAGYVVSSVEPMPDTTGEGTVGWSGREDFADGQPSVELVPAGGADGEGFAPGFVTLVGLLAVVGVGLGVAVAVRRGAFRSGAPTVEDREVPSQRKSTDVPEPDDDTGSAGTDALQTDEDRVLSLLDREGGRIRQRTVAEAFDWSNSKTSRVLSRMAESGEISKLRLGRENVIERTDDADDD